MIGWLQKKASLNSGINSKAIEKVAYLQITGLSGATYNRIN